MSGWQALFYKEVLRFWKVGFQTVAAPVITAILYLMIFGHVLEGRVQVYDSVGYTAFLLPGLVMMSVLQNAFANSSSSWCRARSWATWCFLVAHAAVAPRLVRGLCGLVGGARPGGGFGRDAGDLVVCPAVRLVAPLWIVVFAVMGLRCWVRWA
jgi:ABC-2 type transport system permease protein